MRGYAVRVRGLVVLGNLGTWETGLRGAERSGFLCKLRKICAAAGND